MAGAGAAGTAIGLGPANTVGLEVTPACAAGVPATDTLWTWLSNWALNSSLINFLKLTIKSMKYDDKNAADKTSSIELNIDSLTKTYRDNHIKRLGKNTCLCEPGLIFTDVLIHMEKIGDHLFNITGRIINNNKK